MRVPKRRNKNQISNQPSVKGRNQPTPEEGHGVTPFPFMSTTTTPNTPSPTILDQDITPKKGIGDALLLGTSPVGTDGDQYELLTITVPTVHDPMMIGMETSYDRGFMGKN